MVGRHPLQKRLPATANHTHTYMSAHWYECPLSPGHMAHPGQQPAAARGHIRRRWFLQKQEAGCLTWTALRRTDSGWLASSSSYITRSRACSSPVVSLSLGSAAIFWTACHTTTTTTRHASADRDMGLSKRDNRV